jgi:selenocysteine lyase/cysteine desulfurase
MELNHKITLTRVKADGGGTVSPDDIRKAIGPRTKLIVLTHASNVLGTVQPVAEVGKIAREHDVLFLVDAAQTAGVAPIDLRAMQIDLLAFPGHKSLLGPTGTGALYAGPRAKVKAWREGGTGGDSSSETQPREYPYFLEGGTPNVLGVAGLEAGVRYVQERGLDDLHRHEVELVERLWRRLDELPAYEVFGHRDHSRRVSTISFRHREIPTGDLGGMLDTSFDIATRPGLHCAPYIHRSLGTFPEGTVRVSPGPFNTQEHIARLAEALTEIAS